MNTVTLHFKADNQQLTALDGLYKLASNTVEYVKAIFTLGENWTGFDVVRAAWYTDFECISTVLDGNGECFVPWEVLSYPDGVTLNLYGCDLEEDSDGEAVLIDRLTTYPVKAILVDVDARVCGSETKPVTPSQFEQYIAIVQELVGTVRDITSTELNPDYTLTIHYSDGTSDTVGPIRGAKGETGATGPTGNGISKIEKISTAGLVDTYRITYTNGAHYDYTVTNGAKGETGNGIESIYLTGTSGAVKTYTILFTNGDTFEYQVTDGEVTFDALNAMLEPLLIKDTASGDIASFPDGQNVYPLRKCEVSLAPIQDLNGYDSPWVGGGGVNLFDKDASGSVIDGYVNISGKLVNPIDGEKSFVSSLLPAGTYTISKISSMRFRVGMFSSVPTINDQADSFVTAAPQTATSLTVTLTSSAYLCVYVFNGTGESVTPTQILDSFQIEKGSTAHAWTPYSNICPISGRSSVGVTDCGKNLFKHEFEQGSALESSNTRVRSTTFFQVISGVTYCISASDYTNFSYVINTNAVASYPLGGRDFTYCGNDGLWKHGDYHFTATKDGFGCVVVSRANGTNITPSDIDDVKIQVELGSTATTYEEYQGTTHTIPLGQTVYGGTLDAVSGELTDELGTYTCPSNVAMTNSAIGSQTTIRYYFDNKFNDCKTGETVHSLCDGLKLLDENAQIAYSKDEVGYYINGQRVYVKLNVSTVAEAQALLNGLTFHYELNTPTETQLDPTTISTLYGNNNVWSDGAVEVEYVADTQLWILKKLSE